MTAEWFDLGQRLRAAAEGRAQPRLRRAPIVSAPRPIAIRAHRQGGSITITAAAPGTPPTHASAAHALDLLGSLGVTVTAPTAATLLTDTPGTLGLLYRLAVTAEPGSDLDAVAAHIAWWRDRSDFPSGRAVVDTTAACRLRWITGTAPQEEEDPATWRQWLPLPDDSPAGLLGLHARLTADPPLDHLAVLAEDDEWHYEQARSRHSDGGKWQGPDTTYRAALGLRDRCDAADLYAAALLTDPLYRRRAVHTGDVIVGTAHPLNDPLRRVEITCARLDARLRIGADLTGWTGTPEQPGPRFSGTVRATTVRHHQLVLTLTGVSGQTPGDEQHVTLLPSPPSPHRQRDGRRRYRDLYLTRRSWLTNGRPPTPNRRAVPLDVLIAGAEPN